MISRSTVRGYAARAAGQRLEPFTYEEMLGFAQDYGISPRIELMPMSEANDAILRVRENKARYRVVLVND
ncbi:MAG: hypothetical protein ACXWH0_12730 [Acidimicrobiia bacterium]